MERLFHHPDTEEEQLYKDYKPPPKEPLPLPRALLYLLMAALLMVVVTYVIVGHLIKDLVHVFIDWIFGSSPDTNMSDINCVSRSANEPCKDLELTLCSSHQDPSPSGDFLICMAEIGGRPLQT